MHEISHIYEIIIPEYEAISPILSISLLEKIRFTISYPSNSFRPSDIIREIIHGK